MACRSAWGLAQRLSFRSLSSPTRIRSVHSLVWTNALSHTKHSQRTSLAPFAQYGHTLERPWSRIWINGRKNSIWIQSCTFTTSRKMSTGSGSSPSSSSPLEPDPDQKSSKSKGIIKKALLHENIYTLPNFLTFTRLVSAPVIGYWVLQGSYTNAAILFGVACVTDALDGWIARRFEMQSIVGTILDPMADKTLMTILTVTLALQHHIPIPIAGIILGRDAGLILASFYYRYISLPEPKTFARYWDFSIPSAEVHPTMISKVNTAIQMAYIGLSLLAPVFDMSGHVGLEYLGYTCAVTTIWSGASYVYTKDAVKILHPPKL